MKEFPGYFLSNGLPKKEEVIAFAASLADHLFPVVDDGTDFLKDHDAAQEKHRLELQRILAPFAGRTVIDLAKVPDHFFASLPSVKEMLLNDAALIMEFDPAAHSLEEVVFTYPGFFAILVHRIAHILYKQDVPVIPRMISEWSHSKTGIDINPGATIGCPFCIDHGTGIVIGETSLIGNGVKIYQGVTLGALAVRKEDASIKRHPTIEDNVILYAGSTILGGDTVIGHDSIIGGNTWITESVKPNSIVYHKNQTVVSDRNIQTEPINFII